jgi:hypothetical protein
MNKPNTQWLSCWAGRVNYLSCWMR